MDNRRFYEGLIGKPISDSTWKRDKANIKALGLNLTRTNLEVFSKLKLYSKKTRLPIQEIFKYFSVVKNPSQCVGARLRAYIYSSFGISPHRTTINKWFLGKYELDRVYKPGEVTEILLMALAYKVKRKKNEAYQKSNRSYQKQIKEVRAFSH